MTDVLADQFLKVEVLDRLKCRVLAVTAEYVEVERWDCIDCNRHRGYDGWLRADLSDGDRDAVAVGDCYEWTTTRETDGRGNVSVVTRIRRAR